MSKDRTSQTALSAGSGCSILVANTLDDWRRQGYSRAYGLPRFGAELEEVEEQVSSVTTGIIFHYFMKLTLVQVYARTLLGDVAEALVGGNCFQR